MISTLSGWSCSTRNARASAGGSSRALEGMVRGDALGHPGFDGREVVRRQVPGQQDVVVEAVADGRPDAELRAREEVHDRLGHDVGGRVAHRAEFVLGAGIQQLLGRPALGRLEDLLDLVVRFVAHRVCLRRITEPLVHRQDERFTPAVPPAFTGHARALWGRANGRLPGRFTGRSRVVPRGPIAGIPAWLCSPVPALCGSLIREARPDRRCVRVVVGDTGLEPVTSCMSSKCSNQLS